MGRELKRVALDFNWPLNKPWKGFCNPFHVAVECDACTGTGYSPTAKRLADQWYGYAEFRPEDRGSIPFLRTDEVILAFARRNLKAAPEYYGTSEWALESEATRLADHFNSRWSHHLNADDVAALIASDRLYDLTHTWTQETGWKPKDPLCVPSPTEVNEWSLSGLGHDSINRFVCVTAECERLGVSHTCEKCGGEAEIWPSTEAKQAYDKWKSYEPPHGTGYQIWETVSEGSPISPVFSTPHDLAAHMATTKWGADEGTPYATWLKFIEGPGWAPSMVMGAETGVIDGVTAVVSA